MSEQRCVKRVYGDGRGGQICSRKGIFISADGKAYCKQHLPENVKERDAAKRAKWDAGARQREGKWKAQEIERTTRQELLEAIRTGAVSDITVAGQKWSDAVAALEAATPGAL